MAKTTRELGLFVPPEKERQLRELDELEAEQKSTRPPPHDVPLDGLGRRAGPARPVEHRLHQLLHPEAPGRVRRHGHRRAWSPTSKSATSRSVREGKFYVTRVPEGFFALYWKCPHLGCTVPWADRTRPCPARPTAAIWPLPTRAASSARATARSTTATARSSRAPRRGRWTCFPLKIDAHRQDHRRDWPVQGHLAPGRRRVRTPSRRPPRSDRHAWTSTFPR